MKKNYIKLFLDLAIAVLLILMFNRHATGQLYHEVLGLVLGGLFVAHLALNWSWIKRVTTNLFNPSITTKTRVSYFLNVLLLVGGALILVSGVCISRELFAGTAGFGSPFKMLHEAIPNLGILFVVAHLALNWKRMAAMFKRFRLVQQS